MTRRAYPTLLLMAALLGANLFLAPAPVEARTSFVQKLRGGIAARRTRAVTRVRVNSIRTGISAHKGLVRNNAPVSMPSSNILSNKVASKKVYGDSWSCRESSRLLIKTLAGSRIKMTLDSSGKNAFKWGNEGWVDYHYYLVDNAARPTVLLDPTASSNFAKDARTGGLMHGLLMEAGRAQGTPKAAERLAKRIERGGFGGLLVIANQPEISVYKDALERAARLKAEVTRNAETAH